LFEHGRGLWQEKSAHPWPGGRRALFAAVQIQIAKVFFLDLGVFAIVV
jgi:hypothetical protein